MSVTEQSPEQIVVEDAGRREPRRQVRGQVRVFRNWCKGCGLCIAFCPRQVFTEDADHHPVVAQPERCVACRWCAVHCPDFAIVVEIADLNGRGACK